MLRQRARRIWRGQSCEEFSLAVFLAAALLLVGELLLVVAAEAAAHVERFGSYLDWVGAVQCLLLAEVATFVEGFADESVGVMFAHVCRHRRIRATSRSLARRRRMRHS